LREHIHSNDGEILESLTDVAQVAVPKICRLFLVVPYTHSFPDLPSVEHLHFRPEIVTDLWAERCLQSKRFFEPDEHLLSRPVRVVPIPGFEKLVINSTGVADIDLLHMSKAIWLLGARHDQVLKPGISVLLCNSSKAGEDKLRHAREWHIPAVSVEWLWACIRSGQMQSFRPFMHRQEQGLKANINDPNVVFSAAPNKPAKAGRQEQLADDGQQSKGTHLAKTSPHPGSVSSNPDVNHGSKISRVKLVPGEGFVRSPHRKDDNSELRKKNNSFTAAEAPRTNKDEAQENRHQDDDEAGIGLPLQEMSTISQPNSERPASLRTGLSFRHPDGQPSLPGQDQNGESPSAPEATSAAKTTYITPRADSISGAIKEFLGKARAKKATTATSNGESKKKRLLGRALSNMSNSSRESSNMRASRASSIDSVNTDGLGSAILDETSQTKRLNSSGGGGKGSLVGRASAVERVVKECSSERGDAALYLEKYQEEEEPPPMTQLGYDNPDDAVALREMLAERRRKRTRKGQEDIKPPELKEGKRIKDDVTVAPAGWGTGRRTRQRAKSP
jgi:DNA replication regulator DPB11